MAMDMSLAVNAIRQELGGARPPDDALEAILFLVDWLSVICDDHAISDIKVDAGAEQAAGGGAVRTLTGHPRGLLHRSREI